MVILDNCDKHLPANVATIGCFDGVHRGHCDLIAQVCNEARKSRLKSLLITFSNHPRTVLQTNCRPQLLSSTSEKIALLAKTGADMCIPLLFTKEMSQIPAFQFMKTYLRERLNVQTLLIGFNHHFGKPNNETFDDYHAFGHKLGINVIKASEFLLNGEPVSSSTIRKLLLDGNVAKAGELLGYAYNIKGHIIPGHQIGRKLGFPTANIRPDDSMKLLPKNGGYAVRVFLSGNVYPGMLYIGRRPTFDNQAEQTIEVNILHFNENVYGQAICIEFLDFLRGEQRFSSVEDLRQQLNKDRELAVSIIESKRTLS